MEQSKAEQFTGAVRETLIVALDYDTFEQAVCLVEQLGEHITVYKVGLELFLHTKGTIIDYLHSKNKKVFLDLKFHDITNTVLQACSFAAQLQVFMFNVHCANGEKTMKAVADMLKEKKANSLCIGVTVLTNLQNEDIQKLYGTTVQVQQTVESMALAACNAGLHGIVCSAQEAALIKKRFGTSFVTVCPGIRPAFTQTAAYVQNRKEDQARVMNAYDAVKNGADYLVVGRPITQASDPVHAALAVLEEIRQAKEA